MLDAEHAANRYTCTRAIGADAEVRFCTSAPAATAEAHLRRMTGDPPLNCRASGGSSFSVHLPGLPTIQDVSRIEVYRRGTESMLVDNLLARTSEQTS